MMPLGLSGGDHVNIIARDETLLQTVRVAQMGLKLKENTLNMTKTQHIPSESKVCRTFHAQENMQ